MSHTVEQMNRITVNPQQCGGRPCVRGMRIRVMDVWDLLAAGLSPEDETSLDPCATIHIDCTHSKGDPEGQPVGREEPEAERGGDCDDAFWWLAVLGGDMIRHGPILS